jgi:hypothetical protein
MLITVSTRPYPDLKNTLFLLSYVRSEAFLSGRGTVQSQDILAPLISSSTRTEVGGRSE